MNNEMITKLAGTTTLLTIALVAFGTSALAQDVSKNQTAADQPVDMFNGKSLERWDGDPRFWSVADGSIVGQTTEEAPTERNTFLIWQGGPVGDFQLDLEFRLTGGNSGLQFRSVDQGEHRVTGYQADFDAENNYTGIIYEEGGRGILAPRTRHVTIDATGKRTESDEATCDERALLAGLQANDWNHCRVVARGSQMTHFINTMVTARLDDGEYEKARGSGIIALQLHAGPAMKVEFRNIRLTKFP